MEQLIEQWSHMETAKTDGCAELQIASGFQQSLLHLGLGVGEILEDLSRAGVKGGARFGETQLSRRPLYEPHAETLFDAGDYAADGGRAQRKFLRRLGVACVFDDRVEDDKLLGFGEHASVSVSVPVW